MTRIEIIEQLKNYFRIEELVSREVHTKYGDDAWTVFRTETLHCLLIMREGIDKPFTINDWFWGGKYDERGYRENTCSICKKKTEDGIIYLSGHPLGCAFDFKVKGMRAELVRHWITKNQKLFPCKVRLEHKRSNGVPITWVHFDTKYFERNPKVYLFNI